MKRTLIALLVLSSLLLVACGSTTATAPSVSGVITSISGNSVTITPADGSPSTVTVGYATRVYQPNGLEAAGASVLTVGQNVQVWLTNGTQNAARVNIL